MATALGIDIAERRGCDYVLIRGRAISDVGKFNRSDDARLLLEDVRPDVVAIDSPPGWGLSGGTRAAERDLHSRGISIFWTPEPARGVHRKDLHWMQEGFKYFVASAAAGYPTYLKREPITGTAVEVFPHASACCLGGCLRPVGLSKVKFRRGVLQDQGIDVGELTNIDKVDAALAALTGMIAIEGGATTVGQPDEGLIVLPTTKPAHRYVSTR